jgi:hypothetical protein
MHDLVRPWQTNCGLAIGACAARTACGFGLAFTLSACFEGYPQSDERILTPVEMSQAQRVEAMNVVGGRHYLEERWRYKLNDACELKVSTGDWMSGKHSTLVPLMIARVVNGFDKSDKTHSIFLQSQSIPDTSSVPLVTGANWEDAVQLMSLAQHMQRECVQHG